MVSTKQSSETWAAFLGVTAVLIAASACGGRASARGLLRPDRPQQPATVPTPRIVLRSLERPNRQNLIKKEQPSGRAVRANLARVDQERLNRMRPS